MRYIWSRGAANKKRSVKIISMKLSICAPLKILMFIHVYTISSLSPHSLLLSLLSLPFTYIHVHVCTCIYHIFHIDNHWSQQFSHWPCVVLYIPSEDTCKSVNECVCVCLCVCVCVCVCVCERDTQGEREREREQ